MTENAFERFINSEEGRFVDYFEITGELHRNVEVVFKLAGVKEDPIIVQELKKKGPEQLSCGLYALNLKE